MVRILPVQIESWELKIEKWFQRGVNTKNKCYTTQFLSFLFLLPVVPTRARPQFLVLRARLFATEIQAPEDYHLSSLDTLQNHRENWVLAFGTCIS